MVRIKDIAEKAGVSTTTVSNVIHNNTKKVSPENVKKITHLINEMGYNLQQENRILHKDKSKLIAVIANSHKTYEQSILADPFYGEVVGHIESHLRNHGHYILFYSSPDPDEIFEMIKKWDVDGIITITFSYSNCEKLSHLVNKPIVSIDAHNQPPHNSPILNIGIDNEGGGALMINHLLSLGYEDILVAAYKDYGNDHMRWQGAKKAFENSCEPQKHKIQLDIFGSDFESRQHYFEELAQHLPFKRKTAIFFLSDFFALEAQSFLLSHNISIPQQVGIAGFDGIIYSGLWASPKLTTIKQDVRQKAILAVDNLIKILNNENPSTESIILPLSLIPRDSV